MATHTIQGGSINGEVGQKKVLNVSLWLVQALLFVGFGMAGFMKLTQPLAELGQAMAWVTATPAALVRFIGFAELAGAIGLVLPALTRIKPVLTAWAGAGLATIMVLASFVHVARGEFGALPVNLVLGGLAAFVAWGRFKKAPIAPRM